MDSRVTNALSFPALLSAHRSRQMLGDLILPMNPKGKELVILGLPELHTVPQPTEQCLWALGRQ